MIDNIIDEIKNDFSKAQSLLSEKTNKCKVDLQETILPPEVAWQIKDTITDEFSILGTLGNFSLVKGKAKSKKSFFINMAISSAVKNGMFLNRFRSPLNPGKKYVLYIDTEQSKYHVQSAARRVCRSIGIDSPSNFDTYGLRSETPKERFEMVEYLIENTPNLGFVVIDGIRDLITSINDEAESTKMASSLMYWSEKYNIHIVTVLHENPGSDKARGHLGTELSNKAETVIAIEIDSMQPHISIVNPSSCRNKAFEPFAFHVNESALPEIVEDFNIKERNSKQSFDVLKLSDHEKFKIFEEVFKNGDEFSHGNLKSQVKIHLENNFKGKNGKGDGKITNLITEALNNSWVIQGGNRKPYKLGKLSV